MEKMRMETPDGAEMNRKRLAALADLFPGCITEAKDARGRLCHTVQWDVLQELLSGITADSPEAYDFTWVGKSAARAEAARPTRKTLRPITPPTDSKNWDTTENLYIEGDNLDALKLLQESYLGKVKMIYIDPPYNTGHDFLYNDKFRMDEEDYAAQTELFDEEGRKQYAENSDSNPRFHSDWCSMIYPRLLLARNLLTDDGVIFISIDDNEQANLKKICDEVFGERNFIAYGVWQRRTSSAMSQSKISIDHEYILMYQKGQFHAFQGIAKNYEGYSNPDNDPRGPWVPGDLTVGMNADMRPNQFYDLVDPQTGKIYHPNFNRVWAYIPESMQQLIKEKRIVFPSDTTQRPMKKRFANELKSSTNPFSTWITNVGLNTAGTRAVSSLFDDKTLFTYAKPTNLIKILIQQVTQKDSIILDFFSGSATTAHAVMQLNAEDCGHRKFIMVQLPEACDEKSEAYKAGYRTICDIGKERIRRAGEKIQKEHPEAKPDTGFRVFRVDSTNVQDVYRHGLPRLPRGLHQCAGRVLQRRRVYPVRALRI